MTGLKNSRKKSTCHFWFDLDLLPIPIQSWSDIVHGQNMRNDCKQRGVTKVSTGAGSPSEPKEGDARIASGSVELAVFVVAIRIKPEGIREYFWVV